MTNLLSNLTYSAFLSLDFGLSGYGSGFILSYKTNKYLVTAKHVLYNEMGDLRCKELLITCKDYKGNDDDRRTLIVDTTKAQIKKDENDDISIILVQTDSKVEKYVTIQQEGNNIVSVNIGQTNNLKEIGLANDVYLIGCPTSLIGQNDDAPFDVDRPLLRKGIVAGVNYKDVSFIIDCSSYYGNSGGAILEIDKNGNQHIIGIVLRYIPFSTVWKNNREPKISHIEFSNSGYSICAPIDKIVNLIDPGNFEYLTLAKAEIKKTN